MNSAPDNLALATCFHFALNVVHAGCVKPRPSTRLLGQHDLDTATHRETPTTRIGAKRVAHVSSGKLAAFRVLAPRASRAGLPLRPFDGADAGAYERLGLVFGASRPLDAYPGPDRRHVP